MKLNDVTVICFSIAVSLAPAMAQEGIKRTPLGTIDFPPGYQSVMGLAEIAPNTCSPIPESKTLMSLRAKSF
jgi:hypothetical protein